jgi:hypothetical protein
MFSKSLKENNLKCISCGKNNDHFYSCLQGWICKNCKQTKDNIKSTTGEKEQNKELLNK